MNARSLAFALASVVFFASAPGVACASSIAIFASE